MGKLNIGDKAPEFTATDQYGNVISLQQFRGRKVILYFYPKDHTPGCTAEACNLRDNYSALISSGYQVIGVSADSEQSHKKFAEKHQLPFPLIPDTEKKIASAYEVWQKKKFMGKIFNGIVRTTFIIDENGIIEKIIEKVDTRNHARQILSGDRLAAGQ